MKGDSMKRLALVLCLFALPFVLGSSCDSQVSPPPSEDPTAENHVFYLERFGTDFTGSTWVRYSFSDPILLLAGDGGIGLQMLENGKMTPLFLDTEADLNCIAAVASDWFMVVGDRQPGQDALFLLHDSEVFREVEHPAAGNILAASDGMCCTDQGEILDLHSLGSAVLVFETPGAHPLAGIYYYEYWDEILAVGDGGKAYWSENGVDFEDVSLPGGPDFKSVSIQVGEDEEISLIATGGNEVWSFLDGTWTHSFNASLTDMLSDIASYHDGTVRAVGDEGCIVVFDGSSWSEISVGEEVEFRTLATNLHGGTIAAASDGRLFEAELGNWRDLGYGNTQDWSAIHSVPGGDAFAANGDSLLRYNGTNWLVESVVDFGWKMRDLCVVSENEIWAIAGEEGGIDDFLFRYDGAVWSVWHQASLDRFTALWANDEAVFVAAENGSIWRHLGIEWEWMDGNGADIHDFHGSDLDDLIAVGSNGLILSYHEDGWIEVASGGETLRAIDGPVIVGDGGTLRLHDGSDWQAVDTGVDLDLSAVWYGADDDIWAVGPDATVLRYDGDGWVQLLTHLPGVDFLAVRRSADGTLWIGGSGGYLLYDSE